VPWNDHHAADGQFHYGYLSRLFATPRSASTSLATGCCSTSGHTLDAATRLQDFRALIDELRATLLLSPSPRLYYKVEFGTGNCADYENERERLLWLLKEVMPNVVNDPPLW
jgi:hypothetical protein